MINFTIKNIPTELHKKLKKEAKLHHRSINKEILLQLETVLSKPQFNSQKAFEDAEAHRKKLKKLSIWITNADIEKAKNWGRL